jgi:putative nucleotidyltransferase with HDIG domain
METKYLARVLIVDDDLYVRELLSDKLGDKGYECRTCESAVEGLALLQREAFDLILSDLKMPGMSGLEFLAAAHTEHPATAFLLLTGEHDVNVGIEAMKNGAADYVVKPFKLDSVIRRVVNALEKKRLENEIEQYRHHLEEMVDQRTRQLQSALQQVEETYDQTLEALGAALDLRDGSTAGHSARVTQYAMIIARAMGCSSALLRELTRGAYLHDIGKMGIPDDILLKDSSLTSQEYAVMKTHSSIGYQLVRRISFLSPAAELVLTHQERFDGGGYPLGLRGKQIPLAARIFSIADTLDAMTSDRPYRKALPLDTALNEIRQEAGRQFDPELVTAFLSIPKSAWVEVQCANSGVQWRVHSTVAGPHADLQRQAVPEKFN